MLKKAYKYVIKKTTESAIGKIVRYSFCSLFFMFPGTAISTVGISGVIMTGIVLHSGIIEYTTGKIISKKIEN